MMTIQRRASLLMRGWSRLNLWPRNARRHQLMNPGHHAIPRGWRRSRPSSRRKPRTLKTLSAWNSLTMTRQACHCEKPSTRKARNRNSATPTSTMSRRRRASIFMQRSRMTQNSAKARWKTRISASTRTTSQRPASLPRIPSLISRWLGEQGCCERGPLAGC